MEADNQIVGTTAHHFDALNYVAMDFLPRESGPSRRLHDNPDGEGFDEG